MSRGRPDDWFDGVNSGDTLNDLEVNAGMYHWGGIPDLAPVVTFYFYQGSTPGVGAGASSARHGSTLLVSPENRTHYVHPTPDEVTLIPPRRDVP